MAGAEGVVDISVGQSSKFGGESGVGLPVEHRRERRVAPTRLSAANRFLLNAPPVPFVPPLEGAQIGVGSPVRVVQRREVPEDAPSGIVARRTRGRIAVAFDQPVLGSTWWAFKSNLTRANEKALMLWLNSSLSILMYFGKRVITEGAWMQMKTSDAYSDIKDGMDTSGHRTDAEKALNGIKNQLLQLKTNGKDASEVTAAVHQQFRRRRADGELGRRAVALVERAPGRRLEDHLYRDRPRTDAHDRTLRLQSLAAHERGVRHRADQAVRGQPFHPF